MSSRATRSSRSVASTASAASVAPASPAQRSATLKKRRATAAAVSESVAAAEQANKKSKRTTAAPSSADSSNAQSKRARSPSSPAVAASPAKKQRARSAAPSGKTRRSSRARSPSPSVSMSRSPSRSRSRSVSRSVSRSHSRSRSQSPAARVKPLAKQVASAVRKSVADAAANVARREMEADRRGRSRSVSRSRGRSRSVSQARSRKAAAARKEESEAEEEEEEEDEEEESEDEEEPSEEESESEEEAAPAASPATPARRAHSGVSAGPFTPRPEEAGLKVLPQQTSLPKTPVGRGTSSVLSGVAAPKAIFLSPFAHDVQQGHRQSAARTDGWEGQETNYGGSQATHLVNSQKKAPKQLRPAVAQQEAERAKLTARAIIPSFKKDDTPTINRARSRLAANERANEERVASTRGGRIQEEFDESESSNFRSRPSSASTRPTAAQIQIARSTAARNIAASNFTKGGLIDNQDSTAPFIAAGLLLIGLAHYVLLTTTVDSEHDHVGLRSTTAQVQNTINHFVLQYVQPLLGASLALPALDLSFVYRHSLSSYAAYWLVPLLYLFASYVVNKAFELSKEDAVYIAPHQLQSTQRKQQRYARHVFVACHAFVSGLSFWALYMLAETNADFATSWVAPFVIITSLSWALSEFLMFAHVFSGTHILLWTLVAIVAELAFWRVLPEAARTALPAPVQQLYAVAAPFLPNFLLSEVTLVPLVAIQVAETLKALSGLVWTPIGSITAPLAPLVAYVFALFVSYARVNHVAHEDWLVGVLLTATVGAVSLWEVVRHRPQIQIRKAITVRKYY